MSAKNIIRIISFMLVVTCGFYKVDCHCYFPGELQGVWATQAAPDIADTPFSITYSMVTITHDSISVWGHCYKKLDDNIIIADKFRSPTNHQCFRCFRLVVASVNVAVLVNSGLKSCFQSVEEALLSCPTTDRGSAHLVLYKVNSSSQEATKTETQCPISGIFSFSYERGPRGARGRQQNERCEQPTSEMSNCFLGFMLNLHYRDCNFAEPRRAEWYCLGSWVGLDGQLYMTVSDASVKQGDGRPKYKCGIYKEDKRTGRIYLAFSRDSTCSNDLIDAYKGYERYILYRTNKGPYPRKARESTCHFPRTLRGKWHNAQISTSKMTLRDERNFTTYHMQCIKDYGDTERYEVFVQTNCGKWHFRCLLLKKRSSNILEVMLGVQPYEKYGHHLCHRREFGNYSGWFTLARTEYEKPSRCPILGTYRGELPDAPGYCAELYSDCDRPDIMYHAVDECNPPKEYYEQREYQCLGEWTEDGVVYALTRRRDIHTYECFVGKEELATGSGEVVWIKEAGTSCTRGTNPEIFGMQTIIKETCSPPLPLRNLSLHKPVRDVQQRPQRPRWVPSTSKPKRSWEPITGRPRKSASTAACLSSYQPILHILTSLFLRWRMS